MQEHRAELALFDTAYQYLSDLKNKGESLAPKNWRSEANELSAQKERLYHKMKSMRDEIKTLETLRKTVDQLTRTQTAKDVLDHEIK